VNPLTIGLSTVRLSYMDLDTMAQQLVLRLESLVDTMEKFEVPEPVAKGKQPRVLVTTGPACIDSNLDWMGPTGEVISLKSRKEGYDRQIAICQECEIQQKCLDIAIDEKWEYGIWGGMMPRERRKHVRMVHEAV